MLFTTIHQLLTKIHETRSKKTLHQLELAFMKYDIAISDELGYVTLTKESADMIFNLLGIVNFARTEEKTDK
ncbi:MAG: ATP-binding protein [Longicatena sp.]